MGKIVSLLVRSLLMLLLLAIGVLSVVRAATQVRLATSDHVHVVLSCAVVLTVVVLLVPLVARGRPVALVQDKGACFAVSLNNRPQLAVVYHATAVAGFVAANKLL